MKYNNIKHGFYLYLVLLSGGMSSCTKSSEVYLENSNQRQRVIDYVLDFESMYLMQYRLRYNSDYQVLDVYRGEQHADQNQLQLIATARYSEGNKTPLPDSVLVFNTNGFQVGVIYPDQFNKLAVQEESYTYRWPERPNHLLSIPGGAFVLALAGAKVNWSGAGHLGSGDDIAMMDNFRMLNRAVLKDSINIPVRYKTDGTDRLVNDYFIEFDKIGYPKKIEFFDLLNAGTVVLQVNYREE